MKTLSLLLAFSALISAGSAGGMLPKRTLKKLAMQNFWSTCWGKQTTLDYYLAVKAAQKECLQMVPKPGVFDEVFGKSQGAVRPVVSIFHNAWARSFARSIEFFFWRINTDSSDLLS